MKNDQKQNFPLYPQNGTSTATTRNMSVVPQHSSRPSTLQINGQQANNLSVFTPNDYNKFLLSTPEIDLRLRGFTTPDLINSITVQTTTNEQPSPGLFD